MQGLRSAADRRAAAYGLIIAEIELRDERETFERPPWLGLEVTGQPRYYNSALAQRPYATWQTTAGLLLVR